MDFWDFFFSSFLHLSIIQIMEDLFCNVCGVYGVLSCGEDFEEQE